MDYIRYALVVDYEHFYLTFDFPYEMMTEKLQKNTFPLELMMTIKFLQTFLWVYSGYRKNLSIKVMML